MSFSKSPWFLVDKHHFIRIDGSLSIARKNGNVVFLVGQDNTLSFRIEEKKTEPYDNMVFLNKAQVTPGEKIKLNVDDLILINGTEYTIIDKEEDVQIERSFHERRRKRRPKNMRDPINLVNFFSAPGWALSLYFLAFAYICFKLFLKDNLSAPAEFMFLIDYYKKNLTVITIMLFVTTWFICLLHSFLMCIYFNRNPFREAFSAFLFSIVTYFTINVIFYPRDAIYDYLAGRNAILNYRPHEKVLLGYEILLKSKDMMLSARHTLDTFLKEDEKKLLDKDLNLQVGLVEKTIHQTK